MWNRLRFWLQAGAVAALVIIAPKAKSADNLNCTPPYGQIKGPVLGVVGENGSNISPGETRDLCFDFPATPLLLPTWHAALRRSFRSITFRTTGAL